MNLGPLRMTIPSPKDEPSVTEWFGSVAAEVLGWTSSVIPISAVRSWHGEPSQNKKDADEGVWASPRAVKLQWHKGDVTFYVDTITCVPNADVRECVTVTVSSVGDVPEEKMNDVLWAWESQKMADAYRNYREFQKENPGFRRKMPATVQKKIHPREE